MNKTDLYYEVAVAQYQSQVQRSSGLDARAVAIMAVAATLAGISAVILKDFSGGSTLTWWTGVPTGLIALALLGSVLYGVRGVKPRKWRINPGLRTLASHLESYEDEPLTEWVGDRLQQSVDWNEEIIIAKGRALIRAARCLAAMALLVIVLAVAVNLNL